MIVDARATPVSSQYITCELKDDAVAAAAVAAVCINYLLKRH